MSFKKQTNSLGFTIVELLIVIVIIAILAAITIVAYNGIQSRAKNSAAQSAAASTVKKAEIYNADGPTSTYPADPSALTGLGANGTVYQLTGVTFVAAFTAGTAPSTPSTLTFYRCGTNTNAAATSLPTVTVVTGIKIGYYDFLAGSENNTTYSSGKTSGAAPNTYNITCYITSA